jgi:hypothetical protein
MTDSQYSTPEEQFAKLEVCKSCDQFIIDTQGITQCTACNCSLSLLITYSDQICPLGKW